jgi:hypothetical protein
LRGFWAVAVVLVCVLAGLLGLTGAILAESVPPSPALVQPALVQPALVQPALVRPALVRPALVRPALVRPAEIQQAVSRVSIATRHVRTAEEAAMTGAMHPATDQVMALLIGWVLLAMLGGGLLAPRH